MRAVGIMGACGHHGGLWASWGICGHHGASLGILGEHGHQGPVRGEMSAALGGGLILG